MRRLNMGERVDINNEMLIVHVDSGSSNLNMLLIATDPSGRISDDRYSILESNPSSPDGSLKVETSRLSYCYQLELSQVPETVKTILLIAYDDEMLRHSLPLAITLNRDRTSFNAGPCLGSETAIILAKIYRHQEKWRFAAVAQGYALGISKLIESLGGQAV